MVRMSIKIFSRWQTITAIFLVLTIISVAVFAELIAPSDINSSDGIRIDGNSRDTIPHPPDSTIRLGTTAGQIDIYYALIHGTRGALIFGLVTTLSTAFIGILVGAVSGMSTGWVNQISMRFTDGVLCFPAIAGIAFIQQIIDTLRISQSGGVQMFLALPFAVNTIQSTPTDPLLTRINPVMVALILLCWVPYARTLNVLILQTKRLEYVTAARAAGASTWRTFYRHILPNTISPLVVLASKDIGQMVVLQTTFAFVGFSGMSVWAIPLIASRSWVIGLGGNPLTYWWVYLPITLAIIIFAFTWNLLGDELNHWLDPKRKV